MFTVSVIRTAKILFMSVKYRIYLPFLFALVLFTLNGCYKERDTIATVKVLRAQDSSAVEYTEIRLYYDGSDRIDTIVKTSGNGEATVDFTKLFKAGQSGFAVLDVDVVSGDSIIEPLVGTIKVEQEKKSSQTVFCTKC